MTPRVVAYQRINVTVSTTGGNRSGRCRISYNHQRENPTYTLLILTQTGFCGPNLISSIVFTIDS